MILDQFFGYFILLLLIIGIFYLLILPSKGEQNKKGK